MGSIWIWPPRRVRFVALTAIVAAALLLLPLSAGAHELSAPAADSSTTFQLAANPAFVNCLAQFPNDPTRPPQALAKVTSGSLNDQLTLFVRNIKPGLAFDLFTVQRSNLLSNGTPDPSFTNFGLAWYQSDVQVNSQGTGQVTIRTILLNQIFGFDPDVGLNPVNTFHVGFWFNNPNDAAPCGFDVTHPTPFNGEHNAGPVAMISLPNAVTGLGPLCTRPNGSGGCNP